MASIAVAGATGSVGRAVVAEIDTTVPLGEVVAAILALVRATA